MLGANSRGARRPTPTQEPDDRGPTGKLSCSGSYHSNCQLLDGVGDGCPMTTLRSKAGLLSLEEETRRLPDSLGAGVRVVITTLIVGGGQAPINVILRGMCHNLVARDRTRGGGPEQPSA